MTSAVRDGRNMRQTSDISAEGRPPAQKFPQGRLAGCARTSGETTRIVREATVYEIEWPRRVWRVVQPMAARPRREERGRMMRTFPGARRVIVAEHAVEIIDPRPGGIWAPASLNEGVIALAEWVSADGGRRDVIVPAAGNHRRARTKGEHDVVVPEHRARRLLGCFLAPQRDLVMICR